MKLIKEEYEGEERVESFEAFILSSHCNPPILTMKIHAMADLVMYICLLIFTGI